jgi:hypothetical protein
VKIGVNLPSGIPGVGRDDVLEWARRAEAIGFSTLAVNDRFAYGDYEPLITLAAAAAVTDRIGLLANVIIAPVRRSSAVLAKQLATIDSISGGRLTVGLGVGDREDDYRLSGASMRTRFTRLGEMIEELRAVWTGADQQVAPVGPQLPSGRPPLLLGGRTEAALRRVAQYDTGWTMGLGTPERFRDSVEQIASWRAEAGMSAPASAIASSHYALGDGARPRLRSYILDYFAHLGPYAEIVADNCPADEDALVRTIAGGSRPSPPTSWSSYRCRPASTSSSCSARPSSALGAAARHADRRRRRYRCERSASDSATSGTTPTWAP